MFENIKACLSKAFLWYALVCCESGQMWGTATHKSGGNWGRARGNRNAHVSPEDMIQRKIPGQIKKRQKETYLYNRGLHSKAWVMPALIQDVLVQNVAQLQTINSSPQHPKKKKNGLAGWYVINQDASKGIRMWHTKRCHFDVKIILSWRHLSCWNPAPA